jgi:hypothetical protein
MSKNFFQNTSTQDETTRYNAPQGFSMELGFVMILIALSGLFWPQFLNLNLSVMHCLVLAVSGILGIWCGLTMNRRTTFYTTLGLGIFFLLNSVLGILVGEPGATQFGFFSNGDIRSMAPGFLELGTLDHMMHGILSIAFFWDAFLWRERLHNGKFTQSSKKLLAITKVGVFLFIVFLVLLSVALIQQN